MESGSQNLDRLKNIIDYIEMHIKDEISLEDMSKAAALSKYHLDRVFKLLTDKSLIDYVRSRKLSSSVELLLNSDLSVLDIALEYNFQHEQSYIRSFRKLFHTSPGRLRRDKREIPIVNKIDMGFVKPIGEAMLFRPSFVIKPGFFVVGIKHLINFMDNTKNFTGNKAGTEFFFKHKKLIKNTLNPDIYIGLTECIPTKLWDSYYIPCTEVLDLNNIPSGMVGYSVGTYKYAVFKYICFNRAEKVTIETLTEIYKYIFEKWLPDTSYSMADPFYFERIDYELTRDDYCEVDIYIPVTE